MFSYFSRLINPTEAELFKSKLESVIPRDILDVIKKSKNSYLTGGVFSSILN